MITRQQRRAKKRAEQKQQQQPQGMVLPARGARTYREKDKVVLLAEHAHVVLVLPLEPEQARKMGLSLVELAREVEKELGPVLVGPGGDRVC